MPLQLDGEAAHSLRGPTGRADQHGCDHIGDGTLKDNRSALAAFLIRYSDGSKGVLFVRCHLNGNPPPQGPDATPASVFEGVTASKGFIDYWSHVGPVGGVDGGRTLFHLVPHKDKDEE